MTFYLRQSTAVEVPIGPFSDETDGFTAQTGLTIDITSGDLVLKKGAGDWADKSEGTVPAHESKGWYRCLLDATDTNTVGPLTLVVYRTDFIPVWHQFFVLPAIQYDVLTGAFHFAGTAQDGTSTSITLAAGASSVNDYYNDKTVVHITGGTGWGQQRLITDYVGATQVATVDTWTITPDNTSTYALVVAA